MSVAIFATSGVAAFAKSAVAISKSTIALLSVFLSFQEAPHR
jgi:hypothetical protein